MGSSARDLPIVDIGMPELAIAVGISIGSTGNGR